MVAPNFAPGKKIKKILIANRGEIALRIARACRESQIRSVAVFSAVDRRALHVRYADEAYLIGPAPARESYLAAEKMIEVARRTDCDAVHPGFGFLSENPTFAERCLDAGLIFIGPKPEAMRAVGDKLRARHLMKLVGVPILPGTDRPVCNLDEARVAAKEIGFPLLIKAAAGGGGKGMRLVTAEDEIELALAMAMSEAENAFGDKSVYLERALIGPRHVEIQILCDQHGERIYLGERECSIQRRHQKLIEEAPSPMMTDDLRRAMGEAALKAAEASDYTNAGTVEFLLDESRQFYFLEVNARIQVEHPVTEMVTGIDLVKAQIRIAEGEKLWIRQSDVRINGHAIECRICAEDPKANFAPCPGRVEKVKTPSGPGIRVDAGIHRHLDVPIHYDPMIAKVISWGGNRREAIERMRRALEEYRITGIITNIGFHQKVMYEPDFLAGRIDTSYVSRTLSHWGQEEYEELQRVAMIGASLVAYLEQRNRSMTGGERRRGSGSAWKWLGRRWALR